uniref:LysR family transcriptional regulator n=1 Tax=Thaumasiovibrio occultus TaxID=1891184 RepID=UPI000B363E2B|nr:LysR family transcriptional regulator [Thaumasiovibrio occultus]
MNNINWRGIDLNLLVAFDALFRFRSVTKAAQSLCIGQSAMSHNLSRLRQLLDDPLFERQGQQMLPSERAIEIAPIIAQLLATVQEQILKPEAFSAADFSGRWRIGMTDYAELIFAPILFDAITQAAPHCQLSFHQVNRSNYLDKMHSLSLDAVIGSIAEIPAELVRMPLYRDHHVCLFDANATKLTVPLAIDNYLAVPHALVSPDDQLSSQVDNTLAQMDLSRRVVVGSNNFLTIRHLLQGRNLLCITTELLAKQALFDDQLTLCEPPIPVPGFDIDLFASARNSEHPRWQWLLQLIEHNICQYVNQIRSEQRTHPTVFKG